MTTKKNNKLLSGRYELNDRLGAGGMAEVFAGRDRVLGRTIAVKTLHDQFAGDPNFVARFRREAQSAAALNHPHIVSVYDTGNDNGKYYIVMEYVDGKTLRDVIRDEGPLLPERAAEIAADVCAALSNAHAHGIIHRDIKPANIMLTDNGEVKVADFGIARAVSGDTVTATATVLGTAQYFSPEQAQGSQVDARSDIYSLGVVLYEMLTRQVPFTGSSPVAIAYKHVKEEPILPSRLNPDIPESLESIVMKALAKNPDNRYQSSKELREDLLRAMHGQPVAATPVLDDRTSMVSPLSEETVVLTGRRGAGATTQVRDPEGGRRALGYFLLLLVILGIAAVAIWALTGFGKNKPLLTVPDVVGRPIGTAQQILRDRGFNPDVLAPEQNDEFQPGQVVRQDPEGGRRLRKGESVKLVPAGGAVLIEVPKVEGRTERQAKELIAAKGLVVGQITPQPSSTVGRGRVIDQNPSAGSFVRKGRRVDLVVSTGKETAIVPDVTGRTEQDARDILEARGFVVSVVRESFSTCPQESGRVCRQNPPANTTADKGSTVTIVVAQDVFGPPPESPSPSPNPSPSPSTSPSPSPPTG